MAHPSLFGAGELPEAWSVADVNRHARNAVEGIFRDAIWVHGELVEFKVWRSGHWYFTLRDADASLRCVLWKQQAAGVLARLGALPADGTEVLVRGKPTLWEERGEYRLTASDILSTAVLGAKALEFERVRAALQADGLLDVARKRPPGPGPAHRGGDQPRWRRAPRHRHRHPPPVAGRGTDRRGRAGAG